MGSPSPTTVDQVMGWLRSVLGVWLPRLPFPSFLGRLAALFGLPVSGPLPDPQAPLPWRITVDDWPRPIPGINVGLKNLRIEVRQAPHGSPDFPDDPTVAVPVSPLPVTPGASPSATTGPGRSSDPPQGVSP